MEILKFKSEKFYGVDISIKDGKGHSQSVNLMYSMLDIETAQEIIKEID